MLWYIILMYSVVCFSIVSQSYAILKCCVLCVGCCMLQCDESSEKATYTCVYCTCGNLSTQETLRAPFYTYKKMWHVVLTRRICHVITHNNTTTLQHYNTNLILCCVSCSGLIVITYHTVLSRFAFCNTLFEMCRATLNGRYNTV